VLCMNWFDVHRAMRHFQSLDYRALTVDDNDSQLDTVHQNTITYVQSAAVFVVHQLVRLVQTSFSFSNVT